MPFSRPTIFRGLLALCALGMAAAFFLPWAGRGDKSVLTGLDMWHAALGPVPAAMILLALLGAAGLLGLAFTSIAFWRRFRWGLMFFCALAGLGPWLVVMGGAFYDFPGHGLLLLSLCSVMAIALFGALKWFASGYPAKGMPVFRQPCDILVFYAVPSGVYETQNAVDTFVYGRDVYGLYRADIAPYVTSIPAEEIWERAVVVRPDMKTRVTELQMWVKPHAQRGLNVLYVLEPKALAGKGVARGIALGVISKRRG